MSPELLAERLAAAFAAADLDALAPLLDDNVRWGGPDEAEDDERTCHNRADVLAWFGGLVKQGVRARTVEVIVQPDAVILGLALTWPSPADDRPHLVYQVHRIGNGHIVNICGFPDRQGALDFVSAA